jgi:chaperonin GroES
MARKDVLAAGQRSAQFSAGVGKGKAELKNLAPADAPRNTTVEVKIDRTRKAKSITPKGDMLLVRRRESENISVGGILIPDDNKDKPSEGTVISVGRKVEDTAEGQHIIFGKYAGTEYPWGGETLLFMREDEVIAVVEE